MDKSDREKYLKMRFAVDMICGRYLIARIWMIDLWIVLGMGTKGSYVSQAG